MKANLLLSIFFMISTGATSFAASQSIQATQEKRLKHAADVDFVQHIEGQNKGVKIFSVTGGDPAMNGYYLNLAVYGDIEIGWRVFKLGDVREFKLLPSAKKGFLKISLTKDILDKDGEITQEKSILYLNITKSDAGLIEVEEIKK